MAQTFNLFNDFQQRLRPKKEDQNLYFFWEIISNRYY